MEAGGEEGDLSDLQIMRLCFKGGPATAAFFCPCRIPGVIPRHFFLFPSFFFFVQAARVSSQVRSGLETGTWEIQENRGPFAWLFTLLPFSRFAVGKFFGKECRRVGVLRVFEPAVCTGCSTFDLTNEDRCQDVFVVRSCCSYS